MNELEKAYNGIEDAISSLDYEGVYDADTPRESLEYIKIHINNLQSKIDKAIEFCDYSFKNPWYVSEKELLGKIIDILKEDK